MALDKAGSERLSGVWAYVTRAHATSMGPHRVICLSFDLGDRATGRHHLNRVNTHHRRWLMTVIATADVLETARAPNW